MMGVEYLSPNFTAGELAPTLHSRTDIKKYANGIADAENMIILPHGGLRRRPGLAKVQDTKIASKARLIPFLFNTEQKYIVVMRDLVIDVYRDGALVSTEVSPYTETELYEVDYSQSADTVIFTHQNHAPYRLQRQGSDTNWDMSAIVFDYEPRNSDYTYLYTNTGVAKTVSLAIGDRILNKDGNSTNGLDEHIYEATTAHSTIDLSTTDFTGTGWTDLGEREVAWSPTNGYPRCSALFGGRLWFGGSTSSPTTIWGSKVNGFFDFDLGDGQDDYALEDILDTDQYNPILNIFAGRDLQVFTTGGELYNSASPITPGTSSWKRQTGYGSKRITPILIDGATLFVDSSKRTVRQFLYDYTEDSYVSINVSLLSSHLITDVIAMDAVKGTEYDVGDYVYVVNEDGTVAVLNTMRHEEIQGWTHWTTDGTFEDVCVIDKEVYFLVKRNGEYFLELLTEETYTDHNVLIEGSEPTTDNIVHNGDNIIHLLDNINHTDTSTGTPVTTITTDYDQSLLNKDFKVVADYSIMADSKPTGTHEDNSFSIPRSAYRLEVGLNYTTRIQTLPLATETEKGSTLHRRKRVVKVDVNVIDSLGVYARDRFSGDREFTVVLDKAPVPFTGFKEYYLLGYDRLAEIVVSQKEPLPFLLRSIGYEIEY